MKDSQRGPHRQVRSKDRPLHRGDVPCGICPATFKTPNAAAQHRRDKHGQQSIEQIGVAAYRNALKESQ
jgi:hypothetical protein